MKSARIVEAHSGSNHTLSERAYIALLMLWVGLGFFCTTFGAGLTLHTHFSWGPSIFLIALTFLGCFLGVTESVGLSLFGYFLISFPFGLLLGPIVATYTKASIVHVLGITGIMGVGLGGVGILYPKSLRSWGIVLFGALILLILSQFGLLVLAALGFPVGAAFTALDWIGIVIFSGFLIFDMNRAVRSERTVLSSINFAVAIYLDLLNLFLRLLELFGKKAD